MLRHPEEVPLEVMLEVLDEFHDRGLGAKTERALLGFDHPRLVPAMIVRLSAHSAFVRRLACTVLGRYGNSCATRHLLDALEDPVAMVRRAAGFALAALKDPGSEVALRERYRPEIGHGIESKQVGSQTNIKQQGFDDIYEDLRGPVIEIDLVGREGRPDPDRTVDGSVLRQDIGGSRPNDELALVRCKFVRRTVRDDHIFIFGISVRSSWKARLCDEGWLSTPSNRGPKRDPISWMSCQVPRFGSAGLCAACRFRSPGSDGRLLQGPVERRLIVEVSPIDLEKAVYAAYTRLRQTDIC